MQIAARVKKMCARLDSLRHAASADRYNGPMLFEGRAAARLFSERFAPALVGRRKIMMGRPEMDVAFERATGGGESPFADRLGGRVLPTFLSVVDDPTIAAYGTDSLFGAYRVDEEGVTARATRVVDDGILKTLLTTRTPVSGVDQSTGNRRGGGPAPSNLIVEVQGGLSDDELKAQLVSVVKKRHLAYGLVVRELGAGSAATTDEPGMQVVNEIAGQGGGSGRSLLAVYRLYPDGREELVRGARLAGLTVDAFKDIIAASKSVATYHATGGAQTSMGLAWAFMAGVGGGAEPAAFSSYVVPSLLFDDVTVSKSGNDLPSPPFSPPPSPTE
jgi:hypothetical protein